MAEATAIATLKQSLRDLSANLDSIRGDHQSDPRITEAIVLVKTASTAAGNTGTVDDEKSATATQETNDGPQQELSDSVRAPTLQSILGVTELAENILFNLGVQDLHRIRRVNRRTCEVIAGSIKLQQQLHLRPRSSGHLEIFIPTRKPRLKANVRVRLWEAVWTPLTIRDLRNLEYNGNHQGMPAKFTIVSCRHFDSKELGPRVLSMLVFQPPVYEMTTEMSCCKSHAPSRFKVTSSTGITYADLMKAAEELRVSHKLCSYAKLRHLDAAGYVDVWPKFHAITRLEIDDPMVLRHLEDQKKRNKMSRYIQAKTHGKWHK